MRFSYFSYFSIWFSVFVKNNSGFSVFVPNVVFPIFFPIWTYLGIHFCMQFSVLADFVCGFAVLDEFFFGFAVSSIPQCPPPYWLRQDTVSPVKMQMWSEVVINLLVLLKSCSWVLQLLNNFSLLFLTWFPRLTFEVINSGTM